MLRIVKLIQACNQPGQPRIREPARLTSPRPVPASGPRPTPPSPIGPSSPTPATPMSTSLPLRARQVLNNIVKTFTHVFSMTHSQAMIARYTIAMGLLVHYMSIVWAYAGLSWESGDDSLSTETTWIIANGMQDYTTTRLYMVATYVSTVAIFGGIGTIGPQNFFEYGVISVMLLIGGVAWAAVISDMCGMVSTLNPHEAEHKNTMDQLNYMMEDRAIPKEHRQRLRTYFHQTQDFMRSDAEHDIFQKMSAKLRADTAAIIGRETLTRVSWLRADDFDFEPDFVGAVALSLQQAIYETHEVIQMNKLTIILKGLVARRIHLLGHGQVLGEDCIIEDRHSGVKDLEPANCLSFVATSYITRHELFKVADAFPKAMQHLKETALKFTLKGVLTSAYKQRIGKRDAGSPDLAKLIENCFKHSQASPPEWDVFGADAHQRNHTNKGPSLESKVDALAEKLDWLASVVAGGAQRAPSNSAPTLSFSDSGSPRRKEPDRRSWKGVRSAYTVSSKGRQRGKGRGGGSLSRSASPPRRRSGTTAHAPSSRRRSGGACLTSKLGDDSLDA
mmetsp:Transcript_67374/g.184778  ORF Transcript_67374/g.184778 Transcript_67374/m.184778 type:complete len:561 (+) Transcript_67374:1002-2684(+)